MYIHLNVSEQMTNVELLHSNTWNHLTLCIALSAGAVEYTDCTSAEG